MQILLLELTALVGASVHVHPGEPPIAATVLLEGDRIAAVGPDLALPEGSEVVDATGLHLVPGLIDGMAYADAAHDPLYVSAGVLLIRDHGNDLGRIFRHRALAGEAIAPTIATAGAVLDGSPPATAEALVFETAADVSGALPTLLAEKPDFLAVHRNLPRAAWEAVLAVGREQGLDVWGPRPDDVSVAALLGSSQRGVLYLDHVFPPPAPGVAALEAESLSARVQEVVGGGLALTPLLLAVDPLGGAAEADESFLRYLGPQYRTRWEAGLAAWRLARAEQGEEGQALLDSARAQRAALLARLHAADCELVPGSGAPHVWLRPGLGLHDELALWNRAGLSPAECLRLATSGAARSLGLWAERGSIEAGKRADLVAVAADPRTDLDALRRPRFVVLRGRVLSRAELDEALEHLATTQAQALVAATRPLDVRPPVLPEGELVLSGTSTTSAVGARLSAESWAVVRDRVGRLVFVGRVVLPGAESGDDAVLLVQQRLVDGRLEDFEIRWRARGHEVLVRGLLLAGKLRIERRLNGGFIDNRSAPRAVAVDVGSVTSMLILGHTRAKAGDFTMLRFHEGLEWEAVRWRLELDADGRHSLATPGGPKLALFRADGALADLVEQRGSGFTRTFTEDVEAGVPDGLALPAGKVAAAPDTDLLPAGER